MTVGATSAVDGGFEVVTSIGFVGARAGDGDGEFFVTFSQEESTAAKRAPSATRIKIEFLLMK